MFYSQKNMSTAKMLPEYIDSIYVSANYEYRVSQKWRPFSWVVNIFEELN
jgi:hypothetical protein